MVGRPFGNWQLVFPTMGQTSSIPLTHHWAVFLKNWNKFDSQVLRKNASFYVVFPGLSTNSQIKRYGSSPESFLIILFSSLTSFARTPPNGQRSHVCKPSWHCLQNPSLHKSCRMCFAQFHSPSDTTDTLDNSPFIHLINFPLPLKAQGLPWA